MKYRYIVGILGIIISLSFYSCKEVLDNIGSLQNLLQIGLVSDSTKSGQAIMKAIEFINKERKNKNLTEIALTHINHLKDIESGKEAVKKILKNKDIDALMMHDPDLIMSAMDLVNKYGKMAFMLAPHPDIANEMPTGMRIYTCSKEEGKMISDFINNDSLGSVLFWHVDNEYGNSVVNHYKELIDSNVEILPDVSFDKEKQDFVTDMLDVKSKDPEAIIIIAEEDNLPHMFNALRQGLYAPPLIGNHMFANFFATTEGKEISEDYPNEISYTREDFHNEKFRGVQLNDFINQWEEYFGEAPSLAEAYAYDNIKMMESAHEQNTDSTNVAMESELLNKEFIYDGVMGALNIDKHGDASTKMQLVHMHEQEETP
ncbi:ABC transporter substrate-binding protein [Aureibacter tunicatorum]|uniref:ABC-type branched-subunit amino acid transport system substrate-binding protein n=1 Tax=Aureibacter tunicatorum TaxID=866807 RepID=A0AAE3XHX5_9BACT|nr:ABC transporter substrate-binding protein [Aureibacter tunicatorum]MDR6237122.1 ABC-type branched-subunit amino acid transport system substrate-binding protein [Aureibacter tunicatorum]BDD06114.1 hypothetical protein AUTU_35970 [Aureibacter tunicatorum]